MPKRWPVWLLLSLCVAAITWLYVHRILTPWSEAKDHQQGHIQSQMWDLYPRWVGTRELLLHGKNPYSAEVSHEIQTAFYGRPATPDEEARHAIDEQRFAYPVYVVFLLAPAIHLNFSTVYAWAPVVLGVFAALTVLFSADLLGWPISYANRAALVMLTLCAPQVVQGMRHQQLAVVVACLLTVAAWCVRRGHLVSAGVLLGWATIKPQMALLPLLWFLLWSGGEFKSRWRLPAAFAATMSALSIAGEFLVHGWIRDFLHALSDYQKYFPTTSILRMFLGNFLGWLLSAVAIFFVLAWGWKNRHVAGESREFMQSLAGFLVVALLAFPLFTPFNQAMLVLPALMVLRDWQQLSQPARCVLAAMISWPWIVSAILVAFYRSLNPASNLPLLPGVLATVAPVIVAFLLVAGRARRAELSASV